MKIYSTLALYILPLLVLAASCGSNDDPTPAPGQEDEELIDTDCLRFSEVAATLFESDFTDTVNLNLKPRYGEVLDPSRPAVYSLGFESDMEAQRWFIDHCVPEEERENVTMPIASRYAVEFGEYGRIEYNPAEGSDSFGQVSIEIPGFEKQKKIEFIPKSLWPDNGYSSHFYPGNVVRENSTGLYYLCVAACDSGHLGQLLSIDFEWKKDKYLQKFSDHWKTVNAPVGASEEAWAGLAQMYYNNTENFRALCLDIEKRVPDCILTKYDPIYNLKYELNIPMMPPWRYVCGGAWGSRHLWWARSTWTIYQKYVIIGPKDIQKEKDGMPHFRSETMKIAAHKWVDIPWVYKTSHSETFNNDPEVLDRFTKVYEGDF